jgi:2,4-dienoyl-CoA reductase-like NADH-dependent reductase (Old Yellow Enzyme family)
MRNNPAAFGWRSQGHYDSEGTVHETLDPFKEAAEEAGVLFIAAGGFKADDAAEKLRTGGADLVRCLFRLLSSF